MDGISSASAVLGIASFGLQLYETLKKFANKVAEAHQYLLWLMTDVDLSNSALSSIQELLREDEIRKRGHGARLFTDKALVDAWRTSDQCLIIFRSVVDFILKKGKKGTEEVILDDKHPDYLRLNQKVILSSLGRVNWALAQDDVERLTNRLTTFKLTLNLLVTVVSVKAQNPNFTGILHDKAHDKAFRDEMARIAAFLKARNHAQEKWVLLQASVLQNRSKPNSSSPTIKTPNPSPQAIQDPSPSSPQADNPTNSPPNPMPTLPGSGVLDHMSNDANGSSIFAGTRLPPPPNQNHLDPQSAPGSKQVSGNIPLLPSTNSANPAPGNSVRPQLGVKPAPSVALSDQGNIGMGQARPDAQLSTPDVGSSHANGAIVQPDRAKSGVDSASSPRHSDCGDKRAGSNLMGNSKVSEEDDWIAIEAWLYKDGITRELRYSEPQIRDLWASINRKSSSQWLETFTSLTADEHAGIDEAMDSRKPHDTRKLLGVQISSATSATVFRFLLRLCSLGMLDTNHLETRALLIIIGNKDTLIFRGNGNLFDPSTWTERPEHELNIRERRQRRESSLKRTSSLAHDPYLERKSSERRPRARLFGATTTPRLDRFAEEPSPPRHRLSFERSREHTAYRAEPRHFTGSYQPAQGYPAPPVITPSALRKERDQLFIREKRRGSSRGDEDTPVRVSEGWAKERKRNGDDDDVKLKERIEAEDRQNELRESRKVERDVRRRQAFMGASPSKHTEQPTLGSTLLPMPMPASTQSYPQQGYYAYSPFSTYGASIPQPSYFAPPPSAPQPPVEELRNGGLPNSASPLDPTVFQDRVTNDGVRAELTKSAKDVPDTAVFSGDVDQVRTVAEQEQPESKPKADAIRGSAAIVHCLSPSTRGKWEAQEAKRVHEEQLGQVSKKKGRKRKPQEKETRQARQRRRGSLDSILSLGSSLDGEEVGIGLDEDRIQKLFAKWTPDGGQAAESNAQARRPNGANNGLDEDVDLHEAGEVRLEQLAGINDLTKDLASSTTPLIRGRSQSIGPNMRITAATESRVNSSPHQDSNFNPATTQDKVDLPGSREVENREGDPSPETRPVLIKKQEKAEP